MKSLYQITEEYQEIASQLELGELTPELEKALTINKEELQTKAVRYAFVVKQFESDINAIDEEIKRLQAMKKSKENAKDRIKDTLKNAMLHYNIQKVEVPTLKLSFRESKSVEVYDMDKLHADYIKEKVTLSADKKAIKDTFDSGGFVDGAALVTNQNLQIK